MLQRHFFSLKIFLFQIFCLSLYRQTRGNPQNLMIMNTQIEKYQAAYDEAKSFCDRYFNYSGDKRRSAYRGMSRISEVFVARLNTAAKKLNLPNSNQLYF